MAFKPKKKIQVEEPEEEEEEELEEDEEEEEEPEEEEEEEDSQPVVKKQPSEKPETKKITVNDVLLNHEQRLEAVEAAIFRLKNI